MILGLTEVVNELSLSGCIPFAAIVMNTSSCPDIFPCFFKPGLEMFEKDQFVGRNRRQDTPKKNHR
jgi:hypothetical protein